MGKTKNSLQRGWKKNWQLWVMILPAILFIAIFCYGPMYGIQLAFRDFNFQKGLTGGDWAGLKYFQQYFQSPMFWPTIRNTFLLAVTSIVFGFPIPILLALVINQIKNNKCKKLVQTTIYMPYFISSVVFGCPDEYPLFPYNRSYQPCLAGIAPYWAGCEYIGGSGQIYSSLCPVRNLAVQRMEQYHLHSSSVFCRYAVV